MPIRHAAEFRPAAPSGGAPAAERRGDLPGIGEVLARRYAVESVLDGAGSAPLIAARDVELNELVALRLLGQRVAHGREARSRFDSGLRMARSLRSGHAARIRDFGVLDGGEAFVVMDYVDGQSLAVRLAQGEELPIAHVVAVVVQVCEALAEAHHRGVVHGYLAPEKILLSTSATDFPEARLLDLGVSQVAHPLGAGLARQPGSAKVPAYPAPEQIRDAKRVDRRTDVWALGGVLYEGLTGRRAFPGRDAATVGGQVLIDEPRAPRRLREAIPAALEATVLRCLEKRPDQRYADVAELARALAPFAPAALLPTIERIEQASRGEVESQPVSAPSAGAARGLATLDRRWLAAAAVTVAGLGLTAYLLLT